MAHIARRRLLQLSGAAMIAGSAGGIAGILAAGRAPAYAQDTTVHWLRWADFVPASDQLLRNQIAPECEKALGIKLTLEMINANAARRPSSRSSSRSASGTIVATRAASPGTIRATTGLSSPAL